MSDGEGDYGYSDWGSYYNDYGYGNYSGDTRSGGGFPSWWNSADVSRYMTSTGGAPWGTAKRSRAGLQAPNWMSQLYEGQVKGGSNIRDLGEYYQIQKWLMDSPANNKIGRSGEFVDMVELAKTNPKLAANLLMKPGNTIPRSLRILSLGGEGSGALGRKLENWAQMSASIPQISQPSQQTWGNLTPSERESLAGWMEWTGMPWADFLSQTQGNWAQGQGAGATKYLPAYQR